VSDLCVDGQNMAWVDTLKYLEMYFDTGKTVKVNTFRSVRNFYASANNILSYTRSVNDITRLHLVETYCLSLITYGLHCIFVSVSHLRKYSVCCNSVFKRLFGMHIWESEKKIQYYCVRLDFRHVVDKDMVHFFGNIHKTNNAIVQRCFSNFKRGDKFTRLCNEYGFTI